MNSGLAVLLLGVLAAAVGGAMYILRYHHTVGLAALGLGVILIVAGAYMASKKGGTSQQAQTAIKPA
jgi:hypothetical protein